MTHRISKWVSHSAREHWRAKWADKLFDEVVPALEARGDAVTPVVARGPLPDLTRTLLAEHGSVEVVDARRPKAPDRDGGLPRGALLGLGALLFVAFD